MTDAHPTQPSLGRSLPWLGVGTAARVTFQAVLPLALVRLLHLGPYGAWEICYTCVAVLTPLATLGLRNAYIQYLSGETDAQRRGAEFRAVAIATGVGASLITLMALAATPWVARVLLDGDPAYRRVLQLSLLMIPPGALSTVALGYWQADHAFKRYGIRTVLTVLADATALGLALATGPTLLRVVTALLIARTVVGLGLVAEVWRAAPARRVAFHVVPPYILYGTPMVAAGMLLWLTKLGDRFILAAYRPIEDVGMYALLFNIAALAMLPVLPLHAYAYPAFATLARAEDTAGFRAAVTDALLLFHTLAIPITCGVALLTRPVLPLLGAEAPGGALLPTLMAYLLCGSYVYSIISVVRYVTATRSSTSRLALINLAATAANIGANFVLIPRWGMLGAGVATAGSMSMLLALLLLDLRAHLTVRDVFPLRDLAAPLAAAGAMSYAVVLLRPHTATWWSLVGIVGLGAAVYACGLLAISPAMRARARAYRRAAP